MERPRDTPQSLTSSEDPACPCLHTPGELFAEIALLGALGPVTRLRGTMSPRFVLPGLYPGPAHRPSSWAWGLAGQCPVSLHWPEWTSFRGSLWVYPPAPPSSWAQPTAVPQGAFVKESTKKGGSSLFLRVRPPPQTWRADGPVGRRQRQVSPEQVAPSAGTCPAALRGARRLCRVRAGPRTDQGMWTPGPDARLPRVSSPGLRCPKSPAGVAPTATE